MRRAALALLLLPGLPAAARAAAVLPPVSPFAGRQLFLDCAAGTEQTAAKYSAWYWVHHSSRGRAALLRRIAQVPQAKWFAGGAVRPTPQKQLVRYLAKVDDPLLGGPNCRTRLAEGARDAYVGSYPVMVVRALKHERCRGYDGGGPWAATGARGLYRHWIDSFAYWAGLTWTGPVRYAYRERAYPRIYFDPVVRQGAVILEPDALGLMGRKSGCLSRAGKRRQLALISAAARTLAARLPGVQIYIDAGAADWLTVGEAVSLLRRSGVRSVRGFALNSTHFDTTARQLAYGRRIAARLGPNAHFVVNTAENGRGPLPRRRWGRAKFKSAWCNPANAGLGALPTSTTGEPRADAFLWISRPGLSTNVPNGRGTCGKGPLQNVWWMPRALSEAGRAKVRSPIWPALPL